MGTILTGEGIYLFRILALRGAVQLEAKGIRFKRSMTAQAKRELGLPKGTKREKVLAALDVAVEAQKQVTRPGIDVRSTEA
jgi:hypothetical protein